MSQLTIDLCGLFSAFVALIFVYPSDNFYFLFFFLSYVVCLSTRSRSVLNNVLLFSYCNVSGFFSVLLATFCVLSDWTSFSNDMVVRDVGGGGVDGAHISILFKAMPNMDWMFDCVQPTIQAIKISPFRISFVLLLGSLRFVCMCVCCCLCIFLTEILRSQERAPNTRCFRMVQNIRLAGWMACANGVPGPMDGWIIVCVVVGCTRMPLIVCV